MYLKAGTILGIIVLFTFMMACNQKSASQVGANQVAVVEQGAPPNQAPAVASPTPLKRLPAHFDYPPPLSSLAPTLDPNDFVDEKVRAAYQAAREIPQTIAQLPCFCYCDESFGHKSLHSCYESDHSTGCSTCLDEALMARQLKREGLGDEQVRARIIATFRE